MNNRNINIGKFQKKIFLITFIPMVALSVFNFLLISALYLALKRIIQTQSSIPDLIREVQQCSLGAIWAMTLIFIGALFWVNQESSKMVGAFERLIKELNEFDPDKSGNSLETRKGDTFAKTIAQRINLILEDWVKNKKR